MDPSYQYHQQYATPQTYPPAVSVAPSEAQSYTQHPSESDYAAHYQYNQQAQQYPYYPSPAYYSHAYHYQQQQQPDHPESGVQIHPPGVSVQSDPAAAYDYGQQQPYVSNSYYPQEGLEQQQQQQLGYSDPGYQGQQHWQGNEVGLIPLYSHPQSGQVQHNGAGRSGGRGRGGGPPIRGRGRGRGRGGVPAAPRAPPRMAWCELCRVDCNTPEILEMHKSGKKHKKNLKVQEELQTLAQKTQGESEAGIVVPEGNNAVEGQVSGVKRKKKSGPASKKKKTSDGSTEPKENVPFICELCNVKCESTVVFDSHLKGKKHLFYLQRFQEHQATLGQAALQALYPALEAALLQALAQQQANPNASTSGADATAATGLDQQVLQLLQAFLPQTGAPPPIAPTPALEPDTQEDATAVPSSTLGGESENVATDGTESKPEPESTKIEEPESTDAQQTQP